MDSMWSSVTLAPPMLLPRVRARELTPEDGLDSLLARADKTLTGPRRRARPDQVGLT
ncbi:hypothetical protein ABT369_36605 [Dactylosporangium sp. NPDC000244]|uniref:hypothetical protein n=1 Tax=Dactylosporangium sp. NPDC000244 TaxID=3154365 RepID=UPI0033275C56